MGKTIKEWEEIIKNLTAIELKVFSESISNLSLFEEFDEEYKWTSYKTIGVLLKAELNKRGVEYELLCR
ncbi:MAG: hypothetical protein KKB31_06005 [Nanoarchaeota archaeon]|nr:hypothetical protein [Nanoarchaeota archaeon]